MRKLLIAGLVAGSLAASAPAGADPAAVRLSAGLQCHRAGGAHVSFTIQNVGPRRVRIDPDLHLVLNATRVGDDVGAIVFLWPAPGWDVIGPGESRTFEVDLGRSLEELEGTDLSGLRLHLRAEVWLSARPNPAVRTFSFPACAPPSSPAS